MSDKAGAGGFAVGASLPPQSRKNVTAKDPRGDGDLYDYCADDPVSRRDVSGLAFEDAVREGENQLARGLGLGARGLMDSFLGLGDAVAAPARWLMNKGNEALGGTPDYFKPMTGSIPDALGLPEAGTDLERLAYNVNSTLGTLPAGVAAGTAMLAGNAGKAASSLGQGVGRLLAANPAGQAASGLGSATAVTAAQKAGAGPLGQFAAGLAGGAATPSGGAKPKNAPAARTMGGAAPDAARGGIRPSPPGTLKEPVNNPVPAKTGPQKKPDPFALTPENVTQCLGKSRYKDMAGQTRALDPHELNFSQTTVSYRKQRTLPDGRKIEYTYDDIKTDMYNNGWPKDKSIDAVIMPPDGNLTSVDNTRLAVARELKVDKNGNPIKIQVRVRRPDEALSFKEKRRFLNDRINYYPQIWGDVARDRIRNQTPKIPGQEYGLKLSPRVTGRPE